MRSPKETGRISLGLELEEIFTNRGWEGGNSEGIGAFPAAVQAGTTTQIAWVLYFTGTL